jgi:uncharacterized protein HemX
MKQNNLTKPVSMQDNEQGLSMNTEATMETAQDSQRPSKSNITLSLLAVIIAVIAACTGTWVWMEINHDISEIQNSFLALNKRIEELNAKPELISLSNRLETENSILSSKISEQHERQERLQQSVAKLFTTTAQTPREWTLAKVLYLVELANFRIKFMRDTYAAVMALQAADHILEESVDLSLSKARKAIAVDIEKLKLVEQPNLNVINQRLNRILKEHKYIPLAKPDTSKGEQIQIQETSHSSTDKDDSENMFHALLQEVNRHLVVKRHETPVEPLPSQQTQIYYYQILNIKLESIRLAVLQANNDEYQKLLNDALGWIGSHYTPSTANPLKEELEQLIAINIAPPLPEITESIEAIKSMLDNETLQIEEGASE